jgi:hypothetical protein
MYPVSIAAVYACILSLFCRPFCGRCAINGLCGGFIHVVRISASLRRLVRSSFVQGAGLSPGEYRRAANCQPKHLLQ